KLYLPIVTDGLLIAPSAARSTEVPGGSETVLIVEDDEAVRQVAVGFVQRLGYRVLQAADAAAALELLAANADVALLFTDVVLRGQVNGAELARQALRMRPGLEILFTSGYAPGAMPAQGGLDRPIELLGKPYRLRDLAAMLRRALDGEAQAPKGESSAD
ncbi:MAG: response regulator, partial [Gammaproteobacteria bacterium]